MITRLLNYLKHKVKLSISDANSFHLHWSIVTSRFRIINLIILILVFTSGLTISLYSYFQAKQQNTAIIYQRNIIKQQIQKIEEIQHAFIQQEKAYQSVQSLILGQKKTEKNTKISSRINKNLIHEMDTVIGFNNQKIEEIIRLKQNNRKTYFSNFSLPIHELKGKIQGKKYIYKSNGNEYDVYPTQKGKIVDINLELGYVIIEHPYQILSVYNGFQTIHVKENESIQIHQKIGKFSHAFKFYCISKGELKLLPELK